MNTLSTATLLLVLTVTAFTQARALSESPTRPDVSETPWSGDSQEFFRGLQALNLLELPPAALWPLVERCQRELAHEAVDTDAKGVDQDLDQRQSAWIHRYTCGSVATELARRGTGSDRERLWGAFDEPETSNEIRAGIVRGLLTSRLQEAASEPVVVPAAPPSAQDPLLAPLPARYGRLAGHLEEQREPAWFEEGPPELREAWRLVSSAKSAYLRATLTLASEEPLSFNAGEGGFFGAVADYLRGRVPAAEALKRIGRFEWGSWCGTGANAFLEPRDQALLLALLELGRTHLAAGALLAVADGELESLPLLPEEARPGLKWPRLAERLGLDWERLAIGSLLDGNRSAATAVALLGSEQAARLLLRAMEQKVPQGDATERLGDDDTALAALAALVTPAEGCDGFATGSLDRVREAKELPADVQLDALGALAARADDASGLDLAGEAARQLHRLCRVESLAAFEAMSRSRFAVVREHAAKARRVLAGDGVVMVAPSRVEFRVMVDGTPWRGAVTATARRTDRMTTETLQTDGQGRLTLDRDLSLDTKAPMRALHVEAPHLNGAADTWFVGEVRASRDLRAINVVSVETQTVTIVLPDQHAGRCANGECRVRLESETPLVMPEDSEDESEPASDYRFFQAIAANRPLHAGERWRVRLVRGFRYRAVVESARGSWTSPIVVPLTQPLTLTLRGDRLRSLEEEVAAFRKPQ